VLEQFRDVNAQDIQAKIFSAVGEFCRGIWEDDATLIALTVE
jgi:hypothetical protein